MLLIGNDQIVLTAEELELLRVNAVKGLELLLCLMSLMHNERPKSDVQCLVVP